MQMTDFSFLLYFLPAMLLGYFILSFSRKAQNLWLFLSSLLFYSFGNYIYVLFMLVIVVANYYLGYAAKYYFEKEEESKSFLWLACALNLLPLFFYKYLYIILDSVSGLLELTIPPFPVAPLGISFLTLQGISYVVDIYRGKAKWNARFVETALYFSFFPPLQAGPIICYHDVAEQIKNRETNFENVVVGLCRFVVGLAKIVILAQPLSFIADVAFDQSNLSGIYTTVPISLALLGLVAYALAMYHYLSGFSDLVIGLGRALGFIYRENFNYPILSTSVSEFWTRCYSSLYEWFDKYLYQSLSKQRTNNDHMVLHLLLMWMLIGLWLGLGVTKVVFSIWFFFFILLERIIEFQDAKNKGILSRIYVIFVVLISLVALKTDNIYQFTLFISNLFGMKNNGFDSELAQLLLRENALTLAVGFICTFPIAAKLRSYAEEKGGVLSAAYVFYPVVMIVLVALLMIYISGGSYDPRQLINFHLWS